jgi:UDP-N-acetylglucosamine:LPS N-acetylglucosamine transferase
MELPGGPEGPAPVPSSSYPAARRRVLVVSAGMGAGHHASADEAVRRLRLRGHVAERIDVLDLGRPGQGPRLRRTYAYLLHRFPWVYDGAMRFWARWPRPLERLTAHGAAAVEQGLLNQVESFHPDVVVSVFNLASQALGRLRAAGRLRIPVVTYVIDPGAHPYWVHPAVDLHLANLPSTARALDAWGASRTAVVRPLVAERFVNGLPPREEARRRLGLSSEARVALVSAGSWAVGDIERTADLLARTEGILPLTLCGSDDALRKRLAARGIGIPVGWTDDMPCLMAAADVLVDNAGGLTSWEAQAAGLPVVIHRPLPGHGRLNAEALESAGRAAYARSDGELITLIDRLGGRGEGSGSRTPRLKPLSSGDAVTAVLGLCGSPAVRRAS